MKVIISKLKLLTLNGLKQTGNRGLNLGPVTQFFKSMRLLQLFVILAFISFYSINAQAIVINIDPGSYNGTYIAPGLGFVTGPTSPDLVQGTHTIVVGQVGSFTFSLAADGTVTSNNTDAASGGPAILTFNTTTITVDPGAYEGSWALQLVSGFGSGLRNFVVVPSLNYSVLVGQSGNFGFSLAADGTVTSISNTDAASVVSGVLTFNTTTITVDPGSFTGFWLIQVVEASTGPATVIVVPGLNYRFLAGSGFQDFSVADPCAVDPSQFVLGGFTFNITCDVIVLDTAGPITSNVLANPNPVEVGTSIILTANVDDFTTGGSDIAFADYSINGGSLMSMDAIDGFFDEVSEDVDTIVVAFSEAGVHNICVDGTDVFDNIGTQECILLAVFDPEGGFVTGGGWIISPVGAYTPGPLLTGKAKFGFVSKYKKGANIPTGVTQFKFKVADLNFHSDNYEWLVIAGARAKYKGTGTINGAGGFGFKLTAIDGQMPGGNGVDKFRIKIWDKITDEIIYDNKLGADDSGDDATELGGGSIVIHNK